jgi:colanic acid biosynthesis glycosyl transferase WcaI
MPSKLTNMMASGRPIVATAMAGTQIANVLDGCGIVVEPDDLTGFCAAITELVDNAEKADGMGKSGRQYAESHWNIDKILDNVFDKMTLKN